MHMHLGLPVVRYRTGLLLDGREIVAIDRDLNYG